MTENPDSLYAKIPPGALPDEAYLPEHEDYSAPDEAFAALTTVFSSPADVGAYVLHDLVPRALSTYERLLAHEDAKIAKSAADKVMELAGVVDETGGKSSSGASFTLQLDGNFLNAANKGMEKLVESQKSAQDSTITQ